MLHPWPHPTRYTGTTSDFERVASQLRTREVNLRVTRARRYPCTLR
jgi:hypothetical protein